MIIEHHPDDKLLTAFAGGALDLGRHTVVATHLGQCLACRHVIGAMEQIGGGALVDQGPAALSENALTRTLARIGDSPLEMQASFAPTPNELDDIPRLPKFVRRYAAGRWRPVAMGLSMRPITLPAPDKWRVFLLKSVAGLRLIEHTHTESELTCVLAGGFSHAGGHFGAGDFDFGDPSNIHDIRIDRGEDCISLVAMTGSVKLNGWVGALFQPFIRL